MIKADVEKCNYVKPTPDNGSHLAAPLRTEGEKVQTITTRMKGKEKKKPGAWYLTSAPIFNGYTRRNPLRIFKSLYSTAGPFSGEEFVDFVQATDANDARGVAVSDATRDHSRKPAAPRPYLQPIDTTWEKTRKTPDTGAAYKHDG